MSRWPIMLVFAGLVAGGCTADGRAQRPAEAASPADSRRLDPLAEVPRPVLPVTVASADGRRVTITDVRRIIPLTGALSEIVVTLGLGANVVARDITATFEEARRLPIVTRAHDVSAEGVLALHPTVILADGDTGPPEVMEQLRRSGIPVVIVHAARSLGEVVPRIQRVAQALGVPGAGARLAARTQSEITAAQRGVPQNGYRPRVAFLYLRGSAGVYLIGGKGSGADSMISGAGAVDAGTDMGLGRPFTPLTTEALIAARPDVILVMTGGLQSVGGVDGLVKIAGIAQTPAGRDRRVIAMEDGVLLNFGPRTAKVLNVLVDRLYHRRTG